jgi:hypothetical protein
MLGLSPWTVQDHVKAVYAKTGVSRADLGSLGSARGHEPSALGALAAVTS